MQQLPRQILSGHRLCCQLLNGVAMHGDTGSWSEMGLYVAVTCVHLPDSCQSTRDVSAAQAQYVPAMHFFYTRMSNGLLGTTNWSSQQCSRRCLNHHFTPHPFAKHLRSHRHAAPHQTCPSIHHRSHRCNLVAHATHSEHTIRTHSTLRIQSHRLDLCNTCKQKWPPRQAGFALACGGGQTGPSPSPLTPRRRPPLPPPAT